ncbi:zinc ABC transporter [bacterium]|nr:zinc ABC transporter [bacterium]|tara:strand:+ start:29306 stop:30250 length:945 start_codon:yes stop_codon:yes gene_type:complete
MNNQNKKIAEHKGHESALLGSGNRALSISGWLTGVYFLIELIIGLWTGSVSVISDAFHTFSAVGGVLIALVAGQIARRGATHFRSFGLVRAEIIGALINGVFLLVMAILVLWMGYMRLMDPIELSTTPMLFAAFGGLVTEFISLGLLYKKQKTNLNIRGAYWHVLQTFIGSLLIIIAALVIRFTGFLPIDPILGVVFGLVLVWASWKIIKDATNILLENVPKDIDLNLVKQKLENIKEVKNAHHLHAWSLTTGKNIVSAHVIVEENVDVFKTQKIIYKLLRNEFGVYFSTIQIEDSCVEGSEAKDIDFTIDKKT